MAKNVADLLVEVLVEAGVQRIHGVSGDSLNGITDSIRTRHDIEWVHARHEDMFIFAAGAKHISPENWLFAQAAAAPEICI